MPTSPRPENLKSYRTHYRVPFWEENIWSVLSRTCRLRRRAGQELGFSKETQASNGGPPVPPLPRLGTAT